MVLWVCVEISLSGEGLWYCVKIVVSRALLCLVGGMTLSYLSLARMKGFHCASLIFNRYPYLLSPIFPVKFSSILLHRVCYSETSRLETRLFLAVRRRFDMLHWPSVRPLARSWRLDLEP